MIPFLLNPFLKYYIGENSVNNMKVVCTILEKYVSGEFFISNFFELYYTPFNWYFIKNFSFILDIFEKISKVRLPQFIDDLIYNRLPPDYKYNYFAENPDEIINIHSIIYNTEQIQILIQTMEKNKDYIFNNTENPIIKSLLTKLMLENNQKLFIDIINNEKKDEMNIIREKNKKKKDKKKSEEMEPTNENLTHYFFINKYIINKKYVELLNIKTKTNFLTKFNDKSHKNNKIEKLKKLLCNILNNCKDLVKSESNEVSSNNTEEILNKLSYFKKYTNLEIEDSIPTEWYIKTFINNSKKIDKRYIYNDYEKLYNELEEDINKSIKKEELDFDILCTILNKLKNINNEKNYYKMRFRNLEDYELNQEVEKIIKDYYIPVEIKFLYEDDGQNNIFKITKSQYKEKDKNNKEKIRKYEQLNKVKLCINIENFPKKLPNFVKYEKMQDINIIEIQENLKIPNEISNYIDIIKENLKNNNINNVERLTDKIYDYLFIKIFGKIFPVEHSGLDIKIFEKSILLNWIKLNNFIKIEEEFYLGNFENDVMKYIRMIDSKKSIKKKIINIKKVFNAFRLLSIFNNKKPLQFDFIFDKPLLIYAIIKTQASRIDSNLKLIDLYSFKKDTEEKYFLDNFKDVCNFISEIKYNNLIDVTKEDFESNCEYARKDK